MAVHRRDADGGEAGTPEVERRPKQSIDALPRTRRRARVAIGSQPLFSKELVSGVSRRSVALPRAFEVAPVVANYLRQVGGAETPLPRELEAELHAPHGPPPWRARDVAFLPGALR